MLRNLFQKFHYFYYSFENFNIIEYFKFIIKRIIKDRIKYKIFHMKKNKKKIWYKIFLFDSSRKLILNTQYE